MTRALRLAAVLACNAILCCAVAAQDGQAQLRLDAGQVRYQLDGFGGNYCWELESPVTQYTLDNLDIAWARTEMSLNDWEPDNDNESPGDTDWAYLGSQDKPDAKLRQEFMVARQIQAGGVRYVASVWWLPEWLYADPGKSHQTHGRRIDPQKWPELLECIGSYLLYAKRQYGLEPDLFSFNEPNIGVMVRFSPQEHCDAIKRIGAHLRGLGLKTRMLLGDVAGACGTDAYAQPTADDPAALAHVGAIGFHPWGGGTAAHYSAWGDIAERLKLPLLVTEVGVDPFAYRTKSFDTFDYALRELRMYQELLLYARPQGVMQWQLTSDYSLLREERDDAGDVRLVPTTRYYFVKHFCNLTPQPAAALSASSDHPDVLFTAFVGSAEGRNAYTLHIANLGAGCRAVISGLPGDITPLHAVQTSEREGFADLEPPAVHGGAVEVQLAPRSLLTLTTVPIGRHLALATASEGARGVGCEPVSRAGAGSAMHGWRFLFPLEGNRALSSEYAGRHFALGTGERLPAGGWRATP